MTTEVELAIESNVATVTLNRPDRLNAMNTALLERLLVVIEQAVDDSNVGVIVIRGAGRGFCAGGDLAEMSSEQVGSIQGRVSLLRRHVRVAELLRDCGAVSIAAVHGACAGAGLSLAALCDLRIAARSAIFRSAFLSAGISGDFGLAWNLTQLIGSSRARELMLLNEKIDAKTALHYGLVNKVLDEEDFHGAISALAVGLAATAPLARAAMRSNLNEAASVSLSEALSRESQRHITTGTSADAVEAGRAFLEKRPAIFQGR